MGILFWIFFPHDLSLNDDDDEDDDEDGDDHDHDTSTHASEKQQLYGNNVKQKEQEFQWESNLKD